MELNCDLGLRAYTGDEWKGKGWRAEESSEERRKRTGEGKN